MKISQFIEKLEKEEKATLKKLYDLDTLSRLKEKAEYYEGEDKIISFEEIAENIKNNPDEEKIMTGWKQFDEIIKGFRYGQLVVVSALTKSGKTSWLMDMSSNLAKYNPTWFPFEESAEELMRKFIERGLTVPVGYTPKYMSGNTCDWIELRVIESIAKYNSKIIFIDQLDFIVSMSGDDHSLRIGNTMRALKAIAKKWEVTIFLICHLKKTQMDKQPTLEDLKGSSSIGQEADTVIILWREAKRQSSGEVSITNNTMVSIQANRRFGGTGNIKMVYDNGRFTEFDWIGDVSANDNDFIRRITSKDVK